MMYGTVMPKLFPIALISCILLYMVEIYMLHYVFRKPLEYDDTLHNLMLKYLQLGAIVSLAFSYWQLSNPRLFNEI